MAAASFRSSSVVILRFSGELATTAQGMSDRLDELAVVGDILADAGAMSIRLAEELAAKDLGGLGQVEPIAGDGFDDQPLPTDPLDRLGDRDGQQRGAVLASGGEDGVDEVRGQARPGGVVDRHELATGVHHLQRLGDRVGPLGSALDHLDIHEGHAGAVSPLEQLAILPSDRQDHLADVIPVHERLDGPKPYGPPVELLVDFLLLRVAESRRIPSGEKDHGEWIHRSDSQP